MAHLEDYISQVKNIITTRGRIDRLRLKLQLYQYHIYSWYACVTSFCLAYQLPISCMSSIACMQCVSVYYSEFLFAFSFSFKQRLILSSSLLVSTVSSTLSFHSPFLFLFHSFFFFSSPLLILEIDSDAIYIISHFLSLIEAKGKTNIQSPLTIYDPFFSFFFPSIGLCC